MSESNRGGPLRRAGMSAYRTVFLGAAAAIVLLIFAGMAYLVYLGHMGSGPLLLYAGVILGYLLRVTQRVV